MHTQGTAAQRRIQHLACIAVDVVELAVRAPAECASDEVPAVRSDEVVHGHPVGTRCGTVSSSNEFRLKFTHSDAEL